MLVSLVLPCFHPPANWAQNIVTQYKVLCAHIADPIELILVEDGDDSVRQEDLKMLKAQIPAFRFVKYEVNHGKGYAVRQGAALAEGDIIIYTDIDFPYTTQSITNIYTTLKNNECDVAAGVKNEDYYKHVPFSRRVISKNFRRLIKVFLSIPITDTQCGLKGFKKELKSLFLKTTIERYLFDLEFIRNSYKKGFRVKAIPIEIKPEVTFRIINYRVLLPELLNFVKLLLQRTP
jgi:glycosyltransferase involved in cell wall biosynthesis